MNASKHAPDPGPLQPNEIRDWCGTCQGYTPWRLPTPQRVNQSCGVCGRVDTLVRTPR